MLKNIFSKVEQKIAQGLATKCPRCSAAASYKPQRMDEVITCQACGYLGSVMDWVGGKKGPATHSPEPLVSTKITKESVLGSQVWNIPASGRSGGFLFFAAFWLAITSVVSGGFLYAFLSGKEIEKSGNFPDWALIPFFGIFWAVGIGMAYAGLRAKYAKHRVIIQGNTITIQRSLFFKTKEKSLPDPVSIEQVVFYSQNYTPVYGIEIKARSGKFRFGSSLRDEEKAWLVADFKHALWPEAAAEEAELQAAADAPLEQGDQAFSIVLPKGTALKTFGIVLTLVGLGFCSFWYLGIYRHKSFHASSMPFDFMFGVVWPFMSFAIFIAGIVCLVKFFRGGEVERRLEGTADAIFLRKFQRGVMTDEKKHPRESVHDVRSSNSGEMNGRPMFKVQLITATKAEKLAGWIPQDQAERLVGEIKKAMGR